MKHLYLSLLLCIGLFATETKAAIVTLTIDSLHQPFQVVNVSGCDTLEVINNSGYTDYFCTDTMPDGSPNGATDISPDSMIGIWGLDTSYFALNNLSLLVITHQGSPVFYHVYVTPCLTVGVDDVNNITLNLYPNPTHDKLFINSDIKIESLDIINLSGQIVYQTSLNQSSTQIDVSHLPGGAYMVKLNNDRGIISRRLVISK